MQKAAHEEMTLVQAPSLNGRQPVTHRKATLDSGSPGRPPERVRAAAKVAELGEQVAHAAVVALGVAGHQGHGRGVLDAVQAPEQVLARLRPCQADVRPPLFQAAGSTCSSNALQQPRPGRSGCTRMARTRARHPRRLADSSSAARVQALWCGRSDTGPLAAMLAWQTLHERGRRRRRRAGRGRACRSRSRPSSSVRPQ
jgi:hypothetical protein